MVGQIVFSETDRVVCRRERLSGMPVETVYLPKQETAPRHLRKAAKLLARSGVRSVLVPPDFAYWPALTPRGLEPVDSSGLMQALAAPLALTALSLQQVKPEAATVVLAGKRAGRALWNAAVALCPHVHTLVIDAPLGGAALARHLCREYGMPILERCPSPQLGLLFAPGEPDWEGPVLHLYDRTPGLPGLSLGLKNREIPAQCEIVPLLSALWNAGRLCPEEVAVFPS